ncbi:MAG: peptidylprolyl isomerase, partial [Clostridiales bacterium]|nr:peptidylprolyl isomerase [Candidatus Scatonaster coprocaballi]
QQEEAKKKADALLAAVKTLDDMKTKGEEGKTAGDVPEAAQYTLSRGQMVQEFEDWCFADHKVGDTGIVKTIYGYHVMYFVGTEQADEETKQSMAFDKLQEELQTAFEGGDYVPSYAE